MARHLAIDLGGGSGRVIAGKVINGKIEIEEIHRFSNQTIMIGEQLCWNSELLFENIIEGLKIATQKFNDIKSIGIDSWGIDFALVDNNGNIIGNTVCYRDHRTDNLDKMIFSTIDPVKHYLQTGIQQMTINTLFQLVAIKNNDPSSLLRANRILFTPDYYAYKLCGVMANEYTIASTSELLDANTKDWDRQLIHDLGLPQHLFGNIVSPGTILGEITPNISQRTGLPSDVKVIAVACHDTASAVTSLAEIGEHAAFLSSGTWSLLGMNLHEPVLTEEAFRAGCTNEGGYNNSIRFLQNITGLWILQSLMRQWERDDYSQLLTDAENSDIPTLIDIDDNSLVSPNDMQKAICDLCLDAKPSTQGDYAKVVLQSLAHRYAKGIKELEKISNKKIDTIYIIGGGSKNTLLNNLTEKATGKKIIIGNSEATAIGNILVQSKLIKY